MLLIEALESRIAKSELGQEWIDNPLLDKDVWSLEELGYSKDELNMRGAKNLHFEDFSLSWLKLLTKLAILSTIRKKHSLTTVRLRVCSLKQFDSFLLEFGYTQPELINGSLIEKFITIGCQKNRQSAISYASKLWAEEGWLRLPYAHRRYQEETPSIKAIPEEVLHQIYENFHLFPPLLERLFRLQLALGCRIVEMLSLPRQCLKKEGSQWFLKRWVQKRQHWRFYRVHRSIAELVIEQQKFLDKQLGELSEFNKLFCKLSVSPVDGVKAILRTGANRFDVEPVYFSTVLTYDSIWRWLEKFSQKANLTDKQGRRFKLTSHKFRHTKASIMANSEAEDEYIAAILGHGSLDMLPHYRQRSIERLEKETNAKGYVDKYGRLTSFKPRKRRYERLAELLKVTTPLGQCHRPTMLGDCQYRYACLSCDHHRVTLEDKPKLEADIECLQKDLTQAQTAGQEQRVTEINRLLKLLQDRQFGLEQLEQLQPENHV
jgi:integrase